MLLAGEEGRAENSYFRSPWSSSLLRELRHSPEETHPTKSTALCSIAANDTTSDSLLSIFLASHIGMNRNSSAVEVLRYQWELTRELTSSFCVKSDYQARIIRIKQYGTEHHLEKYRHRNTNPTILFPPNEMAHGKDRRWKTNVLFPKQDY